MAKTASVLGSAAREAGEIASELRREFDVALYQRYGTQAQPDPVLATLFHTFASQIGRLYQEAEQSFPLGVLDDLLAGLGMPARLAQPAQTVVAFTGVTQRERLSLETPVIGTGRSGERFEFFVDESIELAATELRFAAVAESGRLTTIAGARPVRGGGLLLPSTAALAAPGMPPTLWLAFDADGLHLSSLGMMLDTLPLRGPVALALAQSPWHLLDDRAVATEAGTLRAHRGRGGARRLSWLDEMPSAGDPEAMAAVAELADGPYGEQVFIFPPVPPERRWRCGIPAAILPAMAAVLPPEQLKGLMEPLIWIQVSLPAGLAGMTSSLQRVAINAVTASNLEIVAEQVPFDRMGSVVTLQPEGRKGRFLIGVLGIVGEQGTPYAPDAALDVPLGAGRWRYRDQRLDLRPAENATGRTDTYAMVRLLYCDAAAANGIDPGAVNQVGASLANVAVKVTSLAPTRGGAAPPAYAPAKLRFAELVRTRERIVTAADTEIAVRVFEPRVSRVSVEAVTSVAGGRTRQGQSVSVHVRALDFADAEAELPRLEAQLRRHLEQRAVLGFEINVKVVAGD